MPDNSEWQSKSSEDLIDELEMTAALLASSMTPAIAASEIRRIADEIEDLQAKVN